MTVLHPHPAHRSLSLTMIHPPHKGEGKENVMRIYSRLAHAIFATHEMPHYPWRGVRGLHRHRERTRSDPEITRRLDRVVVSLLAMTRM